MKILWVIKKYLDVALDKSVRLEMIRALNRRGHDVVLITGYKKYQPAFGLGSAIKYVTTIKAPGFQHFSFLVMAFIEIIRSGKRYQPGVVILDPHTAFLSIILRCFRWLRVVNYGIVLDIRTYPVHPLGFKGQMENLAFNFGLICAKIGCDSITAITPFMKNMLCKDYGFDPNEMGVWSSGVAMDRFSPGAIPEKEVEDLRNILGLTGKFIVLHHGVLQNGRGLLDAVIATRELIMSGDYQNFIMVFLGSGPMSDVIRKTALDWGIDCHVLVLEPVEHFLVPYYIALADVGILPFPDEMWLRVSSPIKLGEYLSMGKPVIVTNIEAHWDVIGSADCGLYVSPGSPQEIAQAFRQLISLSPTQRSEMGKTGRDIALNYTWDEQAKRLEKALLESLRNLET